MGKKNKTDYGNYILNNKDRLLKRKKQTIMMKRTVLIFSILLIIMITLGLTLPQFNVGGVEVSGIESISEEQVLGEAKVEMGTNIFKINIKEIQEKLMGNTYIENVKVKRSLPNKISIKIEERKGAFYIESEEGIYVIDKEGRVLGIQESVENLNALKINGISTENLKIGEFFQGEEKGFMGAKVIYDFFKEKEYLSAYPTAIIEVSNFVDYKININETYIKLGTSEGMNEKLATAFSILSKPEFNNMKGYVDVSFYGNPVVYREE